MKDNQKYFMNNSTSMQTVIDKQLTSSLDDNINTLKETISLGKSFDFLTRNLYLGDTKAFWIGINGLCNTKVLQFVLSDLQNPAFTENQSIEDLERYMNSKISYAQAQLVKDWNVIIRSLLSGPTVLFIDGFDQAIIIDVRSYPTRSIDEPETEKVTQGAKDGFVETLVSNTALIRRRIRNPKLTFEIKSIGTNSKTDVAIAYIGDIIESDLLNQVRDTLANIDVTSLTMGTKSLEELLIKKRWYNPLPTIYNTQRPDVACSFLLEGYILIIVDNSPAVMVLPCTIFQFTQSPEDYYKNPSVGNYLRIVRFICVFVSLFILPYLVLVGGYFTNITNAFQLVKTEQDGPIQLMIYALFIEVGLDLFKYSSAHAASGFSNALSIVGGLIISDIAIQLHWVNLEVIFYGGISMLASLSISNIDFSEGLRMYRILMIVITGFFGLPGFIIGVILILISAITAPTFAHRSYFWPLYPFNWKALKTLLFRYPTSKAQPTKVWKHK